MTRLCTFSLAIGLAGVSAFFIAGCGSSNGDGSGDYYPGAGDDDGGSGGHKKDGSTGGGGGDDDDSGGGGGDDDSGGGGDDDDGGGGPGVPPVKCQGSTTDSTATALDFTNNQLASPSPPGNLTTANAPQIVVIGWDDVESTAGISFVGSLFGSITNPNGKAGRANLNPNACYGEGWPQPAGKYTCGDGTMKANTDVKNYDIGNHTVDHLETVSTWPGLSSVPAALKNDTGGWTDAVGTIMDQATWVTILKANDTELKSIYGLTKIGGLRAPRLELNDNGLNAAKSLGYIYDQDLEEILPENHVDAAIGIDTDGKKGFNWIPWPYTLDNGDPGIWSQQTGADKKWVQNYPKGLYELPVYQVYVPSKNNLGKTIADRMMASDKPSNCTFPDYVPSDQRNHCFLSDGELNPGDTVKEVTAFDFNTFIYSRMTKDEWLTSMKHTFLLRYYGNRAPLTYGAHPIEYTDPYDSYTLLQQGNNYGYRDVVKYNTYTARQQAMQEFVAWIKGDPTLSKDTYFLSAQGLADYMKAPFDKTGAKVNADTVATPDSNGIFSRLGFTSNGATITVVDGNSADISFKVTNVDDDPVSVSAGITPGALKGVTHIDISYNTDVPFRVRLITKDGTLSTTVLLAGTGGDRTARIRVKDFFAAPEASSSAVASGKLVDTAYMDKVAGISFESAATAITGAKTFTTHIKQITLHGVATSDLCSP